MGKLSSASLWWDPQVVRPGREVGHLAGLGVCTPLAERAPGLMAATCESHPSSGFAEPAPHSQWGPGT